MKAGWVRNMSWFAPRFTDLAEIDAKRLGIAIEYGFKNLLFLGPLRDSNVHKMPVGTNMSDWCGECIVPLLEAIKNNTRISPDEKKDLMKMMQINIQSYLDDARNPKNVSVIAGIQSVEEKYGDFYLSALGEEKKLDDDNSLDIASEFDDVGHGWC